MCYSFQGWLSVNKRLSHVRKVYQLEKEAHQRRCDELENLKEHVAELQAKLTSYYIGIEYEEEGS